MMSIRFAFVLTILALASVVYVTWSWYVGAEGLYGLNQFYGPASNPIIATSLLAALSVGVVVAFFALRYASRRAVVLLLSLCVLFLFLKYFVPNFANINYQTALGDSVPHIISGEYVIFYGKIIGNPIGFFSYQPAFWYAFAIFIEAITGVPKSAFSQTYSLALKWSPLFFMLVYTPVVFLFMKKYGLGKKGALFGILVFYGLSIWSYNWLASQNYDFVIYWLIASFLPTLYSRVNRKSVLIIGIASISLVYIHQVVALMMLLTLSALSLLRLLERNRANGLLAIALLFVIIWATRIFFASGNFPAALVGTVQSAIYELIHGAGPLEAINVQAARAYPAFRSVIRLDEAYFVLVTVVPFAILLYGLVRRGRIPSLKVAATTIFTLGFIFVAGLILSGNGVGGIDRVTSVLLPFSSFSIASLLADAANPSRFLQPIHRLHVRKEIIIVVTIIMVCISSIAYFSSYNTLAVPYSDNYAGGNGPYVFVSCFSPQSSSCSQAYVTQVGVITVHYEEFYPYTANGSFSLEKGTYYGISRAGLFNYVNVAVGNLTAAEKKTFQTMSSEDILYSNPTFRLTLG